MPRKDRASHRAYVRNRYHAMSPEQKAVQNRRVWLARYGLTPEQYDAMLVGQAGRCGLCGEPMVVRSPSVDHDHATVAIGVFETRKTALCEAYLEAHRGAV